MNIGEDLADLIQQQAKEAGIDLKKSSTEIAAYAQMRVEHLKASFGQAGYDRAVKTEARNVAMYALEKAIDQADAADARVWGVVLGALTIAAKVV